jgi:hypothetical protein
MPKKIDISVEVDPTGVLSKPELAAQIVAISCHWNDIEDELITLYAYAMNSDPALAAVTLGRVNSSAARLDMIKAALEHSVSMSAARRFDSMRKEIRKCAGLRSNVIHCHWMTHDDYPDHLIRMKGLSDPHLLLWAWSLGDFAECALRLVTLHVALKEFYYSLYEEIRSASPTKPAWKSSVHHHDQWSRQRDPRQHRSANPKE